MAPLTLLTSMSRVVFVALFPPLLVPAIRSAQIGVPGAPSAGLSITVHEPDGRAVAGAAATVRDAGNNVVGSATSSAEGILRISDLRPGTFTVQVSAAGYTGSTVTVRVASGELAAIDVTLPRAAELPPAQNPVPRPPGVSTPPGSPNEVPPATLPAGVPRPAAGTAPAEPLPPAEKVFVPVPDRWNLSMPGWDRYGERGDYPYVAGHWWDPYNRNRLKGDFPILGQRTFFAFTGVSDTLFEHRDLPVSVAPSSARPLSEAFFGRGDQYLPVSALRMSFDLFRGDTAFRPVDWRVRIQPAIDVNYLHTQETAGVNADVREGTTRLDAHVGLQEAFVEKKLVDLGPSYDFISIRAGIQELSTDFRGFIAVVEQPGVRLFGTLRSGRIEYNGAFFDFLEKDTNSGFNELSRRRQQMAVANIYVQDFPKDGYTTEFSYHYTRDRGTVHYDSNGFLVRPAPIGEIAPHKVRASYFGWAGNGHLGPLNLSHALYQVIGTDELNPIEARRVDVSAWMGALEASFDRDWLRVKGSLFITSGDNDVNDGKAHGFDSIVDVPVFAGGPLSVWNRQGLRLSQTGTGLVSPFSLLPDLRTNKDEGQQNFVNPGIVIVQAGADADLTPKLRAFATVSALRFRTTAPLEALLFQSPIAKNIGVDFGGGAEYRPPLSENVVVGAGMSALRLGSGLRDIYAGRHFFVSLFADLRLRF